MKILIVGGGLGGMMLAASLEQRGLDYHLIEQSPEEKDQGYSLGVWCNTRRLFQKFGLEKQFDELGMKIHTYDICDCSGRVLKNFRFDSFYARYGMAYTQVNRRQLRQLLQLKTHPDRISFATKLLGLKQFPDYVDVSFSNGQTKQYDVVVGADGVHSLVREHAFGKSLQNFTGWRAWYVWIDKRFRTAGMTEFLGPGRCVGIFDDGDRLLAIFFATCDPRESDDPSSRLAHLKKIFHHELATMPGALDGVSDDDVMSTDLASIHMKRWVQGRVVLLGDAAHAFEPHTGLGASMAMEDADALANELARFSTDAQLTAALNNFQNKRQKRVAIAQRLNRRIRMFAFIKSKPMRSLANLLIPHIPQGLYTKEYFTLFDHHGAECDKEGLLNPVPSQVVTNQ
jgi:2-polyprenyl-6-methoxyphenol hydroxylase-like FAD-dependent oxidoreductase